VDEEPPTATQDSDERFFRRVSNELAPFELPVATLHTEPGHFPWWDVDESGQRLIRFAHHFGEYDWPNDPEQPKQAVLLQQVATCTPEEPVEGDDEFLWHTLFAVVRADRFNDGLVATNLLAVTRIANELRRRLLTKRGVPLS
jgi:hypothetical protein